MSNKNFLDFAKPFIDSVKKTFDTMIGVNIVHEKPEIKKDRIAKGDISALIGLSGKRKTSEGESQFRGLVLLSFKTDVYVKIANKMLGENHTDLNDEIRDVGAELVNIILGAAKPDLNSLGIYPDMATPTTVTGVNHTISYFEKSTVILIPFEMELGKFYIEICYTDL